MKVFHGLDTETDNNYDGGQAVLVTIAGDKGEDSLILPKKFDQIFDFLEGREYVAFNADFDIQALLHDTFISYKSLQKLARFKRVGWKGYTFEYVPTKYLFVKKRHKSFRVYDLQQFYGMSLRHAAEKYLGDIQKDDIPRAWYSRMESIVSGKEGLAKKTKVLSYALKDARLAYLLAQKLVSSFEKAGVVCTKLISPASLTMSFFGPQLKKEPFISNMDNRYWSQGFFGGRVEISKLGKIDNVAQYDIHSAYPHVISELTSFKDLQYYQGGPGTEPYPLRDVVYGLYHGLMMIPLDWKFGPLAVRDGNKVIYPVGAVSAWFCRPARQRLEKLGIKIKYKAWAEFVGYNKKPIFHGIEKIYRSRKDPALNLSAKLMLNSLYGKLCENTRMRIERGYSGYQSFRVYGKYTNYVLASHITESVRMRVFDMMQKHRVYMAATDSILVDKRAKIRVGPKLGDWDLKGRYSTAVILGCGRYFLKQRGKWEGYLRGFQGTFKHFDKIRRSRQKFVRIPLLQNLSMLQWANRKCSDDLNVLKKVTRELRLDDDKRYWMGKHKCIGDAFLDKIDSKPWIVGSAKQFKEVGYNGPK